MNASKWNGEEFMINNEVARRGFLFFWKDDKKAPIYEFMANGSLEQFMIYKVG